MAISLLQKYSLILKAVKVTFDKINDKIIKY